MPSVAVLIDALLIVLYFVLIIWIGLTMGRRDASLKEFALGGRRVPWWAVMASIIAAETSAATFLGAPGEGYAKQSIAYAQLVIGLIIGRMLVGYIFLKPYYEYKVYTVYDFLAIRFGAKSRNYTSALFLFMRTLASGTRMFVPAIVMVIAWEVFMSGSNKADFALGQDVRPYIVAIIIVVLLTALYTTIGGIKAVIWTDVVQACIMFGSAIVAVITILYHLSGDTFNFFVGFAKLAELVPGVTSLRGYIHFGWEDWFIQNWIEQQAAEGRGTVTMTPWEYVRMILASDYTIFSATIGTIVGNMAAFGTDQDMVQRLLTAETYKKSRRSLITAAVMDLPIAATFSFIGVLLVAYFAMEPQFKPTNSADVFGSYIINVMPTGIRGIVLAGVFATAMGSLSAALNALATSMTNDWYIPYIRPGRSERHYVTAARVFTAMFALLMILVASLTAYAKVTRPDFRIIPVVIGVAGLFLGPMLGVFLVGMLTKRRGSDLGNIISITTGIVGVLILSGQLNVLLEALPGVDPIDAFKGLWKVSWTWYALVGGSITFFIGVLFRTPPHIVEAARKRLEDAHLHEDKPMGVVTH